LTNQAVRTILLKIQSRKEKNMIVQKVGVVGFGQMGTGIAQVTASAGYNVLARDITSDYIDKGMARITKNLDKALEKGKITEDDKAKVLGNINTTTSLDDLAECDLVIEAVVENMDEKIKTFMELDKIVKEDAVFASNTSSLSITDISSRTTRPDQFLGLHFFNPVHIMKLVEVVRTIATSEHTYGDGKEFAESVGKTVVSCGDRPGFVVNRLLVPYLLDAVRILEDGTATREDIDTGMVLGCGHPMGPLVLIDFIGLDTILYIGDIMFEEFKDPHFAAPPLLRRMVNMGFLGKKSGKGFYDYTK
jgi:3-hydroxybutyryl-CoA dehydrogenase